MLEGRLLQVALQREVTETFPRWLVCLHLHRVALNCVLMPDWTACHHRGACEALQVLREKGKDAHHAIHSDLRIMINNAFFVRNDMSK